tara:strand:- start:2241 stop:2771 length:531 start_codon:yes stop_codon:yes gene_type:complete
MHNHKVEKGNKIASALRQKKHVETTTIDKIKFQGKKENFKKENSNWIINKERELNVDKKIFLTQDEIKKLKIFIGNINIERLKEIINNINHVYPEALRKNGLMEWCVKVCTTYEITLDDFRSKRRYKNLVQARTDFCHAVYKNTHFDYSAIGRFMNRDHTNVMHHIKKLKPKYFVE